MQERRFYSADEMARMTPDQRAAVIDAATCHCDSHYIDHLGRYRPEMDGFEWVRFDRVHRRCARHMGEVLTQKLSLPALLMRLQAHAAPVPAP